jgi:hypothetical protein
MVALAKVKTHKPSDRCVAEKAEAYATERSH